VAGLLLFGLSAFLVGFGYTWFRAPRLEESGNPVNLGLVWETWGYVERYFYGATPEASLLTYGAIEGALETLDDPYTRLVRPQPNELEQDRLRGRFGGIGAYVYQDEEGIYLRPLPGSPAELAGVAEGDRITAVDGEALAVDITVDEVVALIRGPIGTSVRIGVHRASSGEDLEFDIERQEIAQPTVEWRIIEGYDPPVGYVKITLFAESTAEELQRALASVRRDGARLLVLDLRGNPGGLLESGVEVASRFLRQGVVLYEVNARGEERSYPVRPRVRVTEPLVVLVDGGTASASEIVAGALQDHGRATLVGTQTRGKGSVQLAYGLSDGSSLHVTADLWYTPDHKEINHIGLAPDEVVEPQEGGADVVLERGLELLGAGVVAPAEAAR
jgi:carboxyl-terminal processing protease